jgi:hypothetical protein
MAPKAPKQRKSRRRLADWKLQHDDSRPDIRISTSVKQQGSLLPSLL